MSWDEQELAELEDPATWEDESITLPPAQNPGAVVAVRFTSEEVGRLERTATANGLRITEFIRQAALDRATASAADPEPTPVRRPA